MNSTTLLLMLLAESSLIFALSAGVLAWILVGRARKDRRALRTLIEHFSAGRDARTAELTGRLQGWFERSPPGSIGGLEAAVETLIVAERTFLQNFVLVYRNRDSEAVAHVPDMVAALVNAYFNALSREETPPGREQASYEDRPAAARGEAPSGTVPSGAAVPVAGRKGGSQDTIEEETADSFDEFEPSGARRPRAEPDGTDLADDLEILPDEEGPPGELLTELIRYSGTQIHEELSEGERVPGAETEPQAGTLAAEEETTTGETLVFDSHPAAPLSTDPEHEDAGNATLFNPDEGDSDEFLDELWKAPATDEGIDPDALEERPEAPATRSQPPQASAA